MKQSPHDRRIVERMAPGVLCRDGFLAPDTRPLGEIIDTDRSTVERLGTSHAEIAGRLAEILDRAAAACGAPVDVGGGLTAVYHEAMGRIPSPWGEGRRFAKGEVELTDAAGRMLRFTPLSVHLIAEHGFYQGRGSRYRLDPEAACRMLGIGSPAGGEEGPQSRRGGGGEGG
jgi:hypothetical protein